MSNTKDQTSTVKDYAAMGGKARAEKLTPEQRSAIAAKASHSRKSYDKYIKATHRGTLNLGGMPIECAVLEDGKRVITLRAINDTLGRTGKNSSKIYSEGALQLPNFLKAEALQPFITDQLKEKITPVVFKLPVGGSAYGFDASTLPLICQVYLEARRNGALKSNQLHVADRCEIIIQGLAQIGVIALIDEATGYQEDRARNELQSILALYISEELLPWTMKFPHEFFKQLCKLYDIQYKPGTRWPQYFGKFIKKYVYQKLPTGVIEELERLNPSSDGMRSYRHHQFLEPTGQVHLDKQLISVITLMKASDNKDDFDYLFSKINGTTDV